MFSESEISFMTSETTFKEKIGLYPHNPDWTTKAKPPTFFIVLEDCSGAFKKRKFMGTILNSYGKINFVEYELKFIKWI